MPRTKKPHNGAGLFNKRRAGLYPPAMRKLLGEVGTESITSLKVVRAPLHSAVKRLLQLVSQGTYEKAVKDSNYDSMFHLSLVINDQYTLDKQQVVKLVRGTPSNGESMPVNLEGSITIQELVDKTKLKMGNSAFSNYNAVDNNCQFFIKNVLEANGLLTPELESFIMQDALSVFSKMPQFVPKVAETLTDVGAWADKVIEGEGWKEFYKRQTAGKKFGSRQAVNEHMKECSKKYKSYKSV